MPKISAQLEKMGFSFQLTMDKAAWLKRQGELAGTVNDALRHLIDDARTYYSLPPIMVEQLDAEARALGMERGQYIGHVLSLRAAQLMKGEIALPKGMGKSQKK